jgi:hypothetical protein
VDLGVGPLEADVAQPLGLGELAGPVDHRRGPVDPQRAARGGRARGLPGRLPGPTADVQDVVVAPDAPSPAQHLVVPPQLGVVVDRRSGHGCQGPASTTARTTGSGGCGSMLVSTHVAPAASQG